MLRLNSTWLSVLQVLAFLSVTAVVLLWAKYLREFCRRFHQQFRAQTGARLSRAFIFVDPDRLFILNLLLTVICFVLVFWASRRIELALMGVLVTGCLPAWILYRIELRRRRGIAAQLPEMLMLLAATLRSGASLGVAVDLLARQIGRPLGDELEVMQRERRLGVSLDDSLWNLQRRAPSEAMLLFTCLIRVSHANGGRLADALSSLAQLCRRKLLLDAKLAALTAQGRLQAHVMSVIPFLVGLVLWLMEPELMTPLFTTPAGWAVIALMVLLLTAGTWLVRRIGRAR